MLQDEFCECRADLFRKDAPWQPKKEGAFKKKLFFSVQRKEARAWHAIAQAMSIKWMLQDEFCEFRPHLFRKDAS